LFQLVGVAIENSKVICLFPLGPFVVASHTAEGIAVRSFTARIPSGLTSRTGYFRLPDLSPEDIARTDIGKNA
jgi:hypothetical protein